MTKPKNLQIGTMPCPWARCTETAAVYKFRQTASSDAQRRFAGKLYADCPTHGRFGGQASAASQEHILEVATIWRDDERPADAPVPPPKTPEKPASVPVTQRPAPTGQAPVKRASWGTII